MENVTSMHDKLTGERLSMFVSTATEHRHRVSNATREDPRILVYTRISLLTLSYPIHTVRECTLDFGVTIQVSLTSLPAI